MQLVARRAYPFVLAILLIAAIVPLAKILASRSGLREAARPSEPDADRSEAARFNSVGVAYMGQQRFAEAEKQFVAALKAQPDYALAKLNLGVAFLAQQNSDEARKALLEATEKLPRDPFAWYNLGLVYKDTSEPEKAIEGFEQVT